MTIRNRPIGPIALMVSLTIGCEGSSDPAGPDLVYEALPVTAETVEAAVDLFTEGRIDVPPSCGGSVEVNCVNGTPGPLVQLEVARSMLEITPMSEDVYGFTTRVTLATVSDLPVIVDLGEGEPVACELRVNSAAAGAATIDVAGTGTFMSHTAGGPTDRLDIVVNASGLDDGDVEILGGFSCDLASFYMAIYKDLLMEVIGSNAAHLCGAPGPDLFVACEDPAELAARPAGISR